MHRADPEGVAQPVDQRAETEGLALAVVPGVVKAEPAEAVEAVEAEEAVAEGERPDPYIFRQLH